MARRSPWPPPHHTFRSQPILPCADSSHVTAPPGGEGTTRPEPRSTGSFTHGKRGNGGVRYLHVTDRVRNARSDGTAYDTPRQNLTFPAASTAGMLGGKAASQPAPFDGGTTDPTVAGAVLPTGAVTEDRPATRSLGSPTSGGHSRRSRPRRLHRCRGERASYRTIPARATLRSPMRACSQRLQPRRGAATPQMRPAAIDRVKKSREHRVPPAFFRVPRGPTPTHQYR